MQIIAPLLIKAHEGHVLSCQELGVVNQVLDRCHVTMEEAIALNLWSDTPQSFQEHMQYGHTQRYCQAELNRLTQQLQARGCNNNYVLYIVNHIRTMQYQYQDLKECYENALLCTGDTKVSVLSTVKNLHTAINAPRFIANIYAAMHNNPLPSPITVYRAIKGDAVNLTSQSFISTARTPEASFAKYPEYTTIMALTLPAGLPCIDITPFSNYDTTEKEILLPPTQLLVVEESIQGTHRYIKATVQYEKNSRVY